MTKDGSTTPPIQLDREVGALDIAQRLGPVREQHRLFTETMRLAGGPHRERIAEWLGEQ